MADQAKGYGLIYDYDKKVLRISLPQEKFEEEPTIALNNNGEPYEFPFPDVEAS